VAGTFDFAPNSHVAEELPPEEQDAVSMNGWEFTSKPNTPYRAKFKLTMSGMRWRKNTAGTALDVATDPTTNAGRLLNFYKANRKWDKFIYPHEYLGNITCRFAEPVQIPKAMPDSNGLIPDFEITLIHHNPSF
jgi:hypothetical protein